MRIHHKTPTFLINYFYLYLGMLKRNYYHYFFYFLEYLMVYQTIQKLLTH